MQKFSLLFFTAFASYPHIEHATFMFENENVFTLPDMAVRSKLSN